jgi:hypothetical protein
MKFENEKKLLNGKLLTSRRDVKRCVAKPGMREDFDESNFLTYVSK